MPTHSHIKIDGFTTTLDYKSPNTAIGNYKEIERNRTSHGGYLLQQANAIKQYFEIDNIDLEDRLIQKDVVYVEFISENDFSLDFDKFDKSGFDLLSVKEIVSDDELTKQYSVLVMVDEESISKFISKINDYLNHERDKNNKPRNQKLLNNISTIVVATLKSFWVDEPEIPFPNIDESVWWEVWFRKKDTDSNQLEDVLNNLAIEGCLIGMSELVLTEHIVKLVKGTPLQLSKSLLKLDNLAELRKPQEIADFITHGDVTFESQSEYLQDLINRTDSHFNENSVLICLLDSGVNNQHPLITPFLSNNHLYTYNESWGLQDSHPSGGHGTGVAGLAIYGDLTNSLSSTERIQIYHGLESYKIYHHNDPNNPELYGAITESGISTPIIDRPSNLRVYCLTVSDRNFRFKGRPSAWSATLDKICLGNELGAQLFLVCGGNVIINNHDDYPSLNHLETIHDPAQAYNAITIGTYTRKDRLHISTGFSPLVPSGAMAPSNSTSLLFDKNWPNKPDIVFEGGNVSTNGFQTADHEELKLVSLNSDFNNNLFIHFGDTSGATGLASKMAAEIRIKYPAFWPETIRALMIHSAEWTSQMLENRRINEFNEIDKINLLRTVGYGVPNLSKALYSANNSLTLIAERNIQPYIKDGSGKYNEFHLFELPWPNEALISLSSNDVTLKVTLSYYIEPNPGSRRFVTHHQYHSHQLDFMVIKPLEDIDTFTKRVSAYSELENEKPNRKGEPWTLGRSSSKGSIRKDFITMSGAEMAERNILAIYPKNGWYKNLKKQNKFNTQVRYSLVVSLETPEAEIDLYVPVLNQIVVNV